MFFLSCFCYALWSPTGKGLTSWLSFVMSNCEIVTFPLVSWVRCGAWLYRFLIFFLFLTFICKLVEQKFVWKTKVATMPTYDKQPLNYSSQKRNSQWLRALVCSISYYPLQIVQMMILGWPWRTSSRTNLIQNAFNVGKIFETLIFGNLFKAKVIILVSYFSYKLHCCKLPDKRCLSHGNCLYQVMMMLHFLNDVANDTETTL